MKKLKILLLIPFMFACSGSPEQNKEIITENPYLIGSWTGEGGFLNTSFNEEYGPVEIEIYINEDNSITGKIGDAKLIKTFIDYANHGFDIHGQLDSRIKKGKDCTKDHVIMLLVLPETNRENTLTSDANFHLKSNYLFDFNMRVGGVLLSKQPF